MSPPRELRRSDGPGKRLRFQLTQVTPPPTKEPGLPPRVVIAVGATVTVETDLDVVGCSKCELEAFYDDQVLTLQRAPTKVSLGAGNHKRKDVWTFGAERPSQGTEIRVTAKSDAGSQMIPVQVEVRL